MCSLSLSTSLRSSHSLKSSPHNIKTRNGYLVYNIIDRYVKEDAKLADEFFNDGTRQT